MLFQNSISVHGRFFLGSTKPQPQNQSKESFPTLISNFQGQGREEEEAILTGRLVRRPAIHKNVLPITRLASARLLHLFPTAPPPLGAEPAPNGRRKARQPSQRNPSASQRFHDTPNFCPLFSRALKVSKIKSL